MIFREHKKPKGYEYELEDVIGTLRIASKTRLNADTLDSVVVAVLQSKTKALEVKGTLEAPEGVIQFTYKPAPLWNDDDEAKPCDDTLTSTQKQGSAFIQIHRLYERASNSFAKFAVEARKACKSAGELLTKNK